jgi:hypothetical protein
LTPKATFRHGRDKQRGTMAQSAECVRSLDHPDTIASFVGRVAVAAELRLSPSPTTSTFQRAWTAAWTWWME